jgi:Fur family transcriptional regulator, iron response regulator
MSAWPVVDLRLRDRLRACGVMPTRQRMAIAAVLLPRPCHMTAEQVLQQAHDDFPELCRATVYSTLQLFVRHGLLRELPVDGAATVYDSNLDPHHHLYNVDTGEVSDLPTEALRVLGQQALGRALGESLEVAAMDVIVRVRQRRPARATA